MAKIQDFPVARGDDLDVTFVMDPTDNITLTNATVTWAAYAEAFAIPDPTMMVISKSSANGGITVLESPGQYIVHLINHDLMGLGGNYYHETEIVDEGGNHATVCQGTMTVTTALLNP
jgi:hypothetical protein